MYLNIQEETRLQSTVQVTAMILLSKSTNQESY